MLLLGGLLDSWCTGVQDNDVQERCTGKGSTHGPMVNRCRASGLMIYDLLSQILTDCGRSVENFLIQAHMVRGGVQFSQLVSQDVRDDGIEGWWKAGVLKKRFSFSASHKSVFSVPVPQQPGHTGRAIPVV